MGFYDRPYLREDFQSGGGRGGMGGFGRGIMVGMPKPARAVKIMLLINVGVFILQAVADTSRFGPGPLSAAFGATVGGWWQLWRYVTFQFLHAGFWHLGLNMLGLYMLGSPLEKQWGTRRFLWFYLTCGATAGVAYAIMGALVGLDPNFPLVGASGGIFGILLACAVLFPQFRLIFVLFPVPIRMAALIIFGGMIVVMLSSVSTGEFPPQFWSDVAHLGGAVAGAFWIWVLPLVGMQMASARVQVQRGAWDRKVKREAEDEKTIDEILRKIHNEGSNSLSGKEKKTLAAATKRQRRE